MSTFIPSTEETARRVEIYAYLLEMIQLKERALPHFSGPGGIRSFNQYVDDSERILNGYTLSRAEQGKQDWQSNLLDNVTLAKLRATATGIGLKVPEMRFEATSEGGMHSWIHADLLKNITKQTFNEGNPTLHAFLEIWMMMSHGVLFEYEGYKTGGAKQKRVKSFDSRTGDVQVVNEYVKYDAKPYSVILNPQEFYWWDMFTRDVQDQPRIAWVQHFSSMELNREFSKYPNFQSILDKKAAVEILSSQDSLYYSKWQQRVKDTNDYEVIRYYSKEEDSYEIWCNGVPLLQAPLLWGEQDKYYPFAKSISNPFANPNFFVGMSLPGILEAYQDGKNTVLNTMIDKLYRSMEAPMLVGLQNKDLLDWESEFITQGNRYYVPDINQVKPFPIEGVKQGEIAMLQILDRGIDSLSVDKSQQGLQNGAGAKTAREIVSADQHAKEIKGMLYLFLEDLWLQKTRLRVKNILTHLLKDKAASKTIRDQIVSIQDYIMPDGSRGTLDIHVANSNSSLMPMQELQAREMAAQQTGDIYKIVSLLKTVFEEWKIDCYIIPESFHQQDKQMQEDQLMSEVHTITTLFPEFFVANKDKYLAEILALKGKHPEDYNPSAQPPPMPMPGQGAGQGGGQPPQQLSGGLAEGQQFLQQQGLPANQPV